MSGSSRTIYLRSTALAAAFAASLLATGVQAQARTYHFELPQQSLSQSLRDYGRAAGRQIVFTEDLVRGLSARPLKGDLTADQAIDRLLEGTGLQADRTPSGGLMIRREGATGGGQMAQGSEDDDATLLQEIVVTANKREERLHDVALSVTAVTGDDLQRRQELNVADLSTQVPGFSVQRASPSYNRLTLRGQNSGGPGATVAVVVDDVPFTFSGSTANGAITVADLNPYDLARVEVLRGPQGTLYGAGAEGGILKYVTKQPDPAGFGGAMEVGVTSVAHGETGYSGRAWANLPLGDKAAIRASASYEDIPGYIGNWVRNEDDSNGGYRYSGRLSLLLQPTDDITIRASTFLQKIQTLGTYAVNVVNAPDPLHPPANPYEMPHGLSYGSYLDPLQNTSMNYSYLSVDWDLGWARLTSVTSYGVMKFLITGDASGSSTSTPGYNYAEFLEAFVYGKPVAVQTVNYNALNKYNQEFRLASPDGFEVAGLPVEWQGGVFFTREVSTFKQFYNTLDRADLKTVLLPSLGGLSAPSAYNEVSGFGEFTVHFTPQFDVSLGGRLTNVRQHAQVTYSPGLLTGVGQTLPETKSEESSSTFSFAPRYHFSDDAMIYGRIATGFRPGGPQLLFPGAPADFPPSYHSDSTVNYEVGFRTYLFDKRLSLDLAAYYIDWQDIQILSSYVSQPSGVTYSVTGNAGSATSMGIEWNVALRPVKGLTLQWLGSWLDAQLTTDAPLLGAFDGDKLAGVPDLTSTVNADYEWPLFDDWRAYVGATWVHTGELFTGFSADPSAVAHIPLPTYDTFALRAGVSNDRWSLDAFVRNLTDERALLSYGNFGSLGDLGTVGVIQPRTIGLRLGVKY